MNNRQHRRLPVVWFALLVVSCVAADDPTITRSARFRTRPGFQVELVYSVPRETQGSWIALTIDHRGRLIASDQNGGLFRVTLRTDSPVTVESLKLPIGHAHGLLYAFDSLYAVVAENKYEGPGLYRILDRDGDDHFDEVKLLKRFAGTGEHGAHAVILGPDKKSLYVCAGNKTRLPDGELHSRVPKHWGEDDLLPRIWGPIGSEAGTPAPGGWIARTDSLGAAWELFAVGFRNPFDAAFNGNGELFTADADAEYDLGTPWYLPTRVFHVVSGTDFGWRSGAGKWPPHFADTLPPTVELGPGSPTGVTFGYGTKFPSQYQSALYVGDWSYGRVFAVQLSQQGQKGASYRGQAEEFLSGTPLPITDLIVNPHDGAMYFTLGGRGTTSGLYRLRYTGEADAGPIEMQDASLEKLRRDLESRHRTGVADEAFELAWAQLAHEDRYVRHAARLVLEHAAPSRWQDRALVEPQPVARMNAILALARSGQKSWLRRILSSLDELIWDDLDRDKRLMLTRCYELTLLRMSSLSAVQADPDAYRQTRRRLEDAFPNHDPVVTAELCKLLVFLQSDRVPAITIKLLENASTHQQQLRIALPLRFQTTGWTKALQSEYFAWIRDAASWSGGVSMSKYIETIGRDALKAVPLGEQSYYSELLKPIATSVHGESKVRPFVQQWSSTELKQLTTNDLARRDLQRGRKLFAEAMCFDCHRFQSDGGTLGPDLTAVAKRLTLPDLLDAIVEPNKTISDQFAATTVITNDGKTVTGRIVNIMREQLMLQTDMLQPAKLTGVAQSDIAEMRPSNISMMPSGLLDTMRQDEILDLLAFLLSG
jgi:putative heme-binding domain-containing protein